MSNAFVSDLIGVLLTKINRQIVILFHAPKK